MSDFLRDLTDRVKRGAIRKKRILLLPSDSDTRGASLEEIRKRLDLERADDEGKFLPLGIQCLRFFKKENFRGLDEILVEAFGEARRPIPEEISW